jgi:hypothetical protein
LQVQLQPDERLCGQFIGHPGSVKYTAIVHDDGGTDQSTLTDTVKPPPPGTSTLTPPPSPPRSRHPSRVGDERATPPVLGHPNVSGVLIARG